MGLFKKLRKKHRNDEAHSRRATQRRCHFEKMEPRQLLDADPVVAGITYLEDDLGQDTTPDYFEVTFAGGADTTQLTQFVLNGDQDLSGGLTQGDVFFDVDQGQPGAGISHGFEFSTTGSQGIAADDILGVSVSDDGLQLIVDVQNFEAGDILAFTIDVDEVERLRNDRIASGVEFEGTHFDATFVDDNYTFEGRDITVQTTLNDGQSQSQTQGTFFDEYDQLLQAGEDIAFTPLDLVSDNGEGNADRTAAAVDVFDAVPKPIEISGTVFHDANLNWVQDSSEEGIEGVQIVLEKLNTATGEYESVAQTLTDANGDYEFGTALGLTPGTFRLVEIQPDGFLDVGATAGTVQGQEQGVIADDANGNENIIGDIQIPLGGTVAENYDFKEVRPASLSGNVWHDENNDGVFDPNEDGIANVLIQVTRVGAKEDIPGLPDAFANTDPIFVRTDANGHYEVTGLPPGIYELTEINNYPPGQNPLVDFIDGKDSLGNIDGELVGEVSNDFFGQIHLCADEHGVEYNFGEIQPASISGYVSVQLPGQSKLDPTDPNFDPIAGVEIQLFDNDGNLVDTTTTDANGLYEFGALVPGTYTVVQVQPDGFLDGADAVGNVDGVQNGVQIANDRIGNIVLTSGDEGVRYDFCEHEPATIKGTVFHDRNNDGIQQDGEEGIEGVLIQLFDADGNVVQETFTDANGDYCFEELLPGEYKLVETQPTDFLDGIDTLGTVLGADGTETTSGHALDDQFCEIILVGGDQGVEFNFGEIRPGSISGNVHADADGDKSTFNAALGDRPLEGVVLELLDVDGNVLATTTTDANGDYSFNNLAPGEYAVREFTPEGFIDGTGEAGTINGQTVGSHMDGIIEGIVLGSEQNAVNYDFCEHIPAEIKGTVWFDVNNDGIQQDTEQGIAGVTIQLFDADGNLVAEQITDAEGNYCFHDLTAGTYKVRQIQPTDFVDGQESLGNVDGVSNGEISHNDEFCEITIRGGQSGQDFDFGEIRLASVSGHVHIDSNGNGVFDIDDGDSPLSGVTLQLLDSDGNVVTETLTDQNGFYEFDALLPGEYSIRQIQPADLFTAGETVGDGGGVASENLLTGIVVDSGQNLQNHNFCEHEAAEIHGRVFEDGPAFRTEDGDVPDGFRDLRDGQFNANVDTPLEGVRVALYYYIDPATNEIAPRPVLLSEVLDQGDYAHLNGDPNAEVFIETNAQGEYWFTGLAAGNYIVVETQPDGLVDANDIPGTTTGLVFNSESEASTQSLLLDTFSSNEIMDSVVNIRVEAGGASFENNFTEVRALSLPDPPPPTQDVTTVPRNPVIPGNPVPPSPPGNPGQGLAGNQSINFTTFVGGGRGIVVEALPDAPDPYSWHLSVVNGGQPRGGDADSSQPNWLQTSYLSQQDWQRFDMDAGEWTFTTRQDNGSFELDSSEAVFFGMIGGTPLSGDFDGDGDDEMVLYKEGYWMIDLNGNGRWDIDDLMARLGDEHDRPVVGDWDGDGKDDIGIYGPAWEGDDEAIEADPGLPDPDNDPLTRPKNLPPQVVEAAEGARAMRLSSFGSSRIDVIDHVFGYGERQDVPLAGDWNGDSIRTIGIFNDGNWQIDLNGDGRFDYEDAEFTFGRAGDIPLVGDFDGDGIEEVAIYRDGTWIIDSNGNQQRDATDQVFELGGRGDLPVVGDWNGDGMDEPAIYQTGGSQATNPSALQ